MSNADYFIKGARRFSTTVGVGGVANGTDTTIPITLFPSDYSDGDVVPIVFERVSTAGALTPDVEEVVFGVKSGSNLINCIRGVEGTAGGHSAGAVAEIKLFKSTWNRFITGILVEHNQDGTHKAMTSPSFTTPKITTSINDSNGNEVLKTPATASAVNEFTLTNSATGTNPIFEATGGDTNIPGHFRGKASFAKHSGIRDLGTVGATETVNWNNGDRQKMTMDENLTITFSNPSEGQTLTLYMLQDGSGTNTITFSDTIVWADATTPTWTTTASKMNIAVISYVNSTYFGVANKFA